MNKSPSSSAAEIADKIGISARKTEQNIQKLKTKGLIKRIGPDKGGYWEVLGKK
jgi:ATP-dependent DNA helicase RecG